MRTGRRNAFTLVELLVVIAIIITLLAILMPSLARSVFVSQEAVCASGFRQKAVAIINNATDHLGAYHAGTITGSVGLNPWGYDGAFLPMLSEYGVGWELWFCPLMPHDRFWTHNTSFNVPTSITEQNDSQAVADYMLSHSYPTLNMVVGQFGYYAPRKATNGYTPHNGVGATRNVNAFDEWPTRISQPGTGGHPLVSDSVTTHPSQPKVKEAAEFGHPWAESIESLNAAWPDSSVRRRTFDEFELRQDQHWGTFF